MNALEKRYLLLRYRYRRARSLLERFRTSVSGALRPEPRSAAPFWSVFITYQCTAACSYCIQNYSFARGRNASPLGHGSLPAADWLKVDRITGKPETLVIQGGEPLLYKELPDVLMGLRSFSRIQVLTNLSLAVDRIIRDVPSGAAHDVRLECSYHPDAVSFESFVRRAHQLRDAGLLGDVRMVDVEQERTERYLGRFADQDLRLVPLRHVGFSDLRLDVYGNADASNLVRKPPVRCRVDQVLFSPTGDVFNCCTKLYWNDRESSFGNLVHGFDLPSGHYECHDYGFCNPCQTGFMDVRPVGAVAGIRTNAKVLHSNPPPGVCGSNAAPTLESGRR